MQQRTLRLGCWLLFLASLGLAAVIPRVVVAQEPPKREVSGPTAESSEPPLPGELMPRVYMLKDKEGKLQAMPGFPFEQFVELYKLKHQLDEEHRQPDFTIENLVVAGTTSGKRVELTADFTIVVHSSGWVRVPLRLGGAVLREQAAHAGPGEHFLHFEEDGDGYVSWIRSESGKSHHIALKLLLATTPLGPEQQMRLDVPRATMSQLELLVPLDDPVVSVSEGSTLEPPRTVDAGKSRIKVVGLASPFEISWHSAESQVASLPTVLEASAAQSIRIDGRSVNAEAKLSVRSSGGTFDRFQVRLPQGADLVETPQPGFAISPVAAANSKGKVYEVRLGRQTTGPVEFRMVSQRAYDPQLSGELLELSGFDVLGAVRQWGTVSVQVDGNWQIQWGKDERVRDEPAAAGHREDITAAFEYSAQPYSLTARITPQRTRIRVEGEYVVLVAGDEAQLRAKLKYMIRGAKVRVLEVDMPGWEVDRVGPGGAVNSDQAEADAQGLLVVPLTQPTSGELELTIEARRKIAPNANRVDLELPRPNADTVAPSGVAVVPADNVELVVDPEASEGLAAQPTRPAWKQLPERQQDPQFFRTTGSAAKLVASLKVFEQVISAALATHVEVDDREARVDERIAFQIAYYPTDHLTLDVPKLVRADRMTVTLDGQKLTPAPVKETGDENTGGRISMRVPLGAPRIGRCELAINYSLRHERLSSTGKTSVKVPLVLPGESQLTSNELSVVPKPGVSVSYPKGFPVSPWIEDSRTGRQAGPGTIALTARRGIPEVTLALTWKDERVESASTVEQAWIQTRLTDGHRQDRAVYRAATTEPRLRVSLPEGADLSSLEVLLDARRIKPEYEANGQSNDVIVPISAAAGNEHVLELRYHFAERSPIGQLALEPPRFKPSVWIRQTYWQLILPAQEHLIKSPAEFTREFSWVWTAPYWRRQAPLDEPELERWIGVAPLSPQDRDREETAEQAAVRQRASAAATNRYLFSSLGTPTALAPYSMSRSRLVLAASLPLLALGLLLIYFPVTRHPTMALAVALGIAAGSLIDPEAALLVAQAASVGLALAIGAALLARVSVRPRPVTVPVRGSSRSLEREAADMYQRTATGGSPLSTTTNPLLPTATPESAS
jgi:hypothetical protein